MPTYVDQPCSTQLLDKIEKSLFDKVYSNQCVNFVGFPGSGKMLEIKYLVKNRSLLSSYNSNHLFTYIDLAVFLHSPETALSEALIYLENTFSSDVPLELAKEIQRMAAAGSTSKHQFMHVINKIVSAGFEITFIADNAYVLYKGNSPGIDGVCGYLTSLRRLNVSTVTFMFITTHEFSTDDMKKLGVLGNLFVQNFVFGRDLLFDKESHKQTFAYQEKWNKAIFSPDFKVTAGKLAGRDPSTLRLIVAKGVSDAAFQKKFVDAADRESLYKLVGAYELDQRFGRIIDSLEPSSRDFLKNKKGQATDHLVNAGLVEMDKSGNVCFVNELFEYFVEKRMNIGSEKVSKVDTKQIVERLTGQELVLYKFFETKKGEMVSRDAVAGAVWGSSWEEKYTDWALDQLVSRLRAKLKEVSSLQSLKTVKGQGFLYS